MDPYKQQPAAPPEQDPYHFIMNAPNAKKKGGLTSPNHASMKSRLLVALGIGTALIIVFILFSSLVLNKKDNNAQSLTGLVAEQQEIIRVADLGLKDATDASTKAYAETVKLSVTTQKNELTAYLTKKKQTLTPVQLAAKKDAKTDATLAAALKNNRFDDTVITTLKTSLTAYKTGLDKNYKAADSKTTQTILKNAYTSTVLLLK